MTVWAGVDIGNATTEVVLCGGGAGLDVLASARTPTRGGKGSLRAVQGAAQLARRLADAHGLVIDRAAFAPTPPVHSTVERVQLETRRTGRLTIATRSAATTAGDAAGVGVPVTGRTPRRRRPRPSDRRLRDPGVGLPRGGGPGECGSRGRAATSSRC